MSEKTRRLKNLADVQARIYQLHQTRRAALLAQAHAAEEEAKSIGERSYEATSLSNLFPELYARKVGEALARRDNKLAAAAVEAQHAATAKARADKIAEYYQSARALDQRQAEERDRLEGLEQRLSRS